VGRNENDEEAFASRRGKNVVFIRTVRGWPYSRVVGKVPTTQEKEEIVREGGGGEAKTTPLGRQRIKKDKNRMRKGKMRARKSTDV